MTDVENKTADNDIIDINLDGVTRTRFRINGDPTAVIELNISDLGIVDRLEIGLKTLREELSEVSNLSEDDEELSAKLKQADLRMREQIDYIFDSPVSAVCARYGTMYDIKDGKFRFEAIIDGLMKLYSDNIHAEAKKVEARMQKHIGKYTTSKKKR